MCWSEPNKPLQKAQYYLQEPHSGPAFHQMPAPNYTLRVTVVPSMNYNNYVHTNDAEVTEKPKWVQNCPKLDFCFKFVPTQERWCPEFVRFNKLVMSS